MIVFKYLFELGKIFFDSHRGDDESHHESSNRFEI